MAADVVIAAIDGEGDVLTDDDRLVGEPPVVVYFLEGRHDDGRLGFEQADVMLNSDPGG